MIYTDQQAREIWGQIDWKKIQRYVQKLQRRIYKASESGDFRLVRKLQKLLTRSKAAKLLATRRVTQDNQGKRTPGVDGRLAKTEKERLVVAQLLEFDGKSKPIKRVMIPKPGKKEKRPLGIPTILDRAKQMLAQLALEPEWEAKFLPNNYGFRPGRSAHDAIMDIWLSTNKQPKYVYESDIEKCFDKINHEALLYHLNTYPTLRRQIKAWLKSGVMEGKQLFPTNEGTPQGGVISPLLANIALHFAIDTPFQQYKDSMPKLVKCTGKKQRQTNNPERNIHLIRYADDFVILNGTTNLGFAEVIKESLSKWGLNLKESKTRFSHTKIDVFGQKSGFDFLGFNINQVDTTQNKQGFTTLVRPSKDSFRKHYRYVGKMIRSFIYHGKFEELMEKLKPIVTGWCNYFDMGTSSNNFQRMEHLIWHKVLKTLKKKHCSWGIKKIVRTYELRGIDYGYGTHHISRHTKVRDEKSPYDGDYIYWSQRQAKYSQLPTAVSKLLAKQKDKCAYCNGFFQIGDKMEVDHIVAKRNGGKDNYRNYQLLHNYCHDRKSLDDLVLVLDEF